ncbi:uncharacterized protein B0I36DRAFT_364926 [Microdochium trichocladiopsis]|uniref:Uncharacterized protein n=1 Tax=Microdochium trichocladiopsis TaxID=1682393 RepID=A0A9P9BL68_9PEZI|nr:uncharacterized protein B0I36DRAFT_364926 [Microdochium trichocladiopsis]KAH7027772.1 hypothetical protein B0I36DRAFT_364926 [Microdochium trichocladiopsis]
MKFTGIISALFTMATLGQVAQASPIACTSGKRDAILRGELPAEACCPYGICRNDVVVAMAERNQDIASGLRYNTGKI